MEAGVGIAKAFLCIMDIPTIVELQLQNMLCNCTVAWTLTHGMLCIYVGKPFLWSIFQCKLNINSSNNLTRLFHTIPKCHMMWHQRKRERSSKNTISCSCPLRMILLRGGMKVLQTPQTLAFAESCECSLLIGWEGREPQAVRAVRSNVWWVCCAYKH